MDRDHCIELLESAASHPHEGLPPDVFRFVSRITPLINVDLLVQDGQGRTLLTWRDDEWFGAGWHIPGSIIRYKETAAARVAACARDELGADVAFDQPPILISELFRDGRDRGHFISLLYRCRLTTPLDDSRRAHAEAPSAGEWQWHRSCPVNLIDAQRHYARFFHDG
jgi:colanic acid biosynthesis protein WcaH